LLLRIRGKRSALVLRVGLVALAWALMTATIILAFVFQGFLVPGIVTQYRPPGNYALLSYLLVTLVAVASGMILRDMSATVTAFITSLGITVALEYFVLALPSSLGQADPSLLFQTGLAPIPDTAIAIVFYSLFPVAIILGFIGSLIGAALGESLLD
jgi:hypothetical protein